MKRNASLLECRTLRRGAKALAAAALMVAAASTAAFAGACGDHVDGARVACACGDRVVSDTVLWATDPVVSEPCRGDGLLVTVPKDVDGITLNLGGQSLLGYGTGAGIRVVNGGRLGSVIVGGDADDSRAEIARFGVGVHASGRNVLREIRGIDIHDNSSDGLKIHVSGVRVDDVRSIDNGRHGVSISGHGNEVAGVVADANRKDGLNVHGSAATIDARTNSNGRNGTAIGGRGNHVESVVSEGNRGAGIRATGTNHDLGSVQAAENAAGDLTGRARSVK